MTINFDKVKHIYFYLSETSNLINLFFKVTISVEIKFYLFVASHFTTPLNLKSTTSDIASVMSVTTSTTKEKEQTAMTHKNRFTNSIKTTPDIYKCKSNSF